MDKIYNAKYISLDEYKIKKSNKEKFNKDKTNDLTLIEQLYLKNINNAEIAKILNMEDRY